MARRIAELDYRVTGDGAATSKVRTLAQALELQKRNAQAAVPAMAQAQKGAGMLGSVSAASTAQVLALGGSLGPLGIGLGTVASKAPMAAQGLLQMVAATERMGLLSRATNAALLGGAGVMAAGAVTSIAYAGAILRGADAYASMNARLKIFSDGSMAAAYNEQELYERAAAARAGVQDLSTLFVRITPAIQDMGRAQSDALNVTEMTSKALAIQGATMAESAASTVQFSQALASGVLRGDELRSMMESSPLLLRYIAQNLELNGKIGVSFGQMRALGAEGKLTAEKLIEALLRAKPQIEADFINAPKTAQQGWRVLQDTITRTIGQMAQNTGLQQGVFSFLSDLSKGLDDFRKKMVMDQHAFDPVVEGGKLIGETLDKAADLAGGVVEHFDMIVTAGQAIIALKVGEVLATGFGAAALKAREAYTAIQNFRANGPMLAGAAMDQTGAAAAMTARQAAISAEARAIDLKTQAEVRARTATAARAAADAASAEVTRLKSAVEVNAVAVTEAEALASAQVAAAVRAEAAAKSAATASTNAATASSVRHAVALEAEAAVTAQVTNAQALKAAGMRGLQGLYGLVGGSVGVLTLALGGLVFAIMQEERAWRDHIDAVRDAVVISEQMESLSRALATATWAEVPALMAKAEALRQVAIKAQQAAEAEAGAARAYSNRMNTPLMQLLGGVVPGIRFQQISAANHAADAEQVAAEGRADSWEQNQASFRQQWSGRAAMVRELQRQNEAGKDAYGNALTPSARAANTQQIGAIVGAALREERRIAPLSAGADATAQAHQGSEAHGNVASSLRASLLAVQEVAGMATTRTPAAVPAAGGGGKGRSSSMSAEDRSVLTLLEKVADGGVINQLMGRTATSTDRFTVKDGKLQDGGQTFVARSEDEARAASAYLEQIKAINEAKGDLIEKTGMTREALAAQAEQTLTAALATSQATQAEQRWQDKLAEARGESRAVVQAEREVSDSRRQGATITDEAAQAYINLIKAQEAARKSAEALNRESPLYEDRLRKELDEMGRTPQRYRSDTGEMGFDVDAALKQWAEHRAKVDADRLAAIPGEVRKAVEQGGLAETAVAEETARRIAAMRAKSETANAEQVAGIWQRQREDDARAWEDRLQDRLDQERQLADNITGSVKDLFTGTDASDVGKRFVQDLLSSMYDELIGNPLNLMIRGFLRSMMSGGKDGGAGGLWSSVLSAIGFGGGGTGNTGIAGVTPLKNAEGGLPGASKPGMISGPGGPTDDRILSWVSNREFIMTAQATKRHLPMLQRMNLGLPMFSGGGLPGGLSDTMSDEIARGDFGYTYAQRETSMDFDRDRVRYEAETQAAQQAPINLQVINQTDTPVQPSISRGANGDVTLLLRPLVQSEVKTMGRTGELARAARSAPKPKRR